MVEKTSSDNVTVIEIGPWFWDVWKRTRYKSNNAIQQHKHKHIHTKADSKLAYYTQVATLQTNSAHRLSVMLQKRQR